MVVCPLCEHPQALGDTCDVCGRTLRDLGAVPVAVPALEGLDATALEEGEGAPVLEPMPELTSHRAPKVEVAGPRIPGLEPTGLAEAGAAEPTSAQVASTPACRYCGHRQSQGALCDRCGMQMPRIARASAENKRDDEMRSPCPVCGVKGRLRERCLSCGAQLKPSGSEGLLTHRSTGPGRQPRLK